MAEHPKVFDHVGLLVNESPGMPDLLFTKLSDHCLLDYTTRNGECSVFDRHPPRLFATCSHENRLADESVQ